MAAERFDCFISYARASSTQLAVDLQHGLERFAKPWNKLRAMRVFRDDQSMAANTALWSTIERGLREARWMVLLATPESAASEYVNTEVAWWVHNHGAETILLVHSAGTLAWDRRSHTFTHEADAVPHALRAAYREEPRWIDMTWFGAPGSLGKADPRFIERVADLASAIHGVERDVLIGENVRLHRKTRQLTRAAISGLAVLLVLALVAGVFAFLQAGEAVRQRDAAREQSLVAKARQLAATGVNEAEANLQRALLLSATAYRTHADQQTETALHQVLATTPQLVGFFDFGEPVVRADATPDGNVFVAGGESGKVYRMDRASGERSELFALEGQIDILAVSADGKTVGASSFSRDADGMRTTEHSAVWVDGKTRELDERFMALSPSGQTWVTIGDNGIDDDVLSVHSGGRTTSVPTPGSATSWVVLPNDQVVVSMNEYGQYLRASLDGTVRETTRTPMGTWMFGGNLSPDGNRFTYTNSDTDVQVWDLNGPLLPEYGDSPIGAQAPPVQLSALALNGNGSKLAMAADGAIYVDDVGPRGQGSGYLELRGAGQSPESLKFLSDDVLFSSSGTAVALWDLRKTTPLATVIPAEVGDACSACWAPRVVPSPDGTKIVITNESGSSFLNTETGFNPTFFSYDDPLSAAAGVLIDATATAWLDDDRLFTYDAKNGRGSILKGDELNVIEREFDLPTGDTNDLTQLAVQYDGRVLAMSGNALFTVDPASGDYEVADGKATALTSGGGFAVDIGEPSQDGTRVRVIDTDGFEVVRDVTIDGVVTDFAAQDGNSLMLLRLNAPMGFATDTEFLSLSLGDGAVRTLAKAGARIIAENTVASRRAVFTEENGSIAMFSLDDAARLSLLPVQSAVRAWNGLGVTADGSTLVVASETADAVIKVSVSPDEWVSRGCSMAGRDAQRGDLDGVASPDGLVAGCGPGF